MILGIDVSTYIEELEHGAKFYDGDLQIDPLDAFRQNGVNYMRIRVWNDPYSDKKEPYLAGNCDIENYINCFNKTTIRTTDFLLDYADCANRLLLINQF